MSLILDMDGVIWRNKIPIGKLDEIFQRLLSARFNYVFATNNSTKTVSEYRNILEGFGIPVSDGQIFTSGLVTAKTLKGIFSPGSEIFVIGMSGLKETIKSEGFIIGSQNPAAVVVGLDQSFTYQDIKIAVQLIMEGLPFFGTNPDVALPTTDGFLPGTGSILAAIQAASGIGPIIIGKPQPLIFRQALEYLQTSPDETLVVGDRLTTDIVGGQAVSCKTALVLSGVSRREEAEQWFPKIDYIADDLTGLLEVLND